MGAGWRWIDPSEKKSLTQMAVPLAMAETPVPRRADCRRPPREVHTPPAGPYWGQLIGELPHGAARQIFSLIAETRSRKRSVMGCRWPCPPGALFRESRRVMVALAQRLNTQPPAGGKHGGVSLIASWRGQRRAHGCSPLPRAWAIATSAPLRNLSRDGCPPRVQHLPVVGLGCPRDVLNPRTPSPTGCRISSMYCHGLVIWQLSCEGT